MVELGTEEWMEKLASGEPVPGGGGASALCGAMCAALASMVCNLTAGKKKYAGVEKEILASCTRLTEYRRRLLVLVEEDAECFRPLSQAYGLPKKTEEEQARRAEVLEAALEIASRPPFEMLSVVGNCLDELPFLAQNGSRLAVSDVGVSAAMGKAAINGACLNVYINTKLMKNRETAENLNVRTKALVMEGNAKADAVYDEVEGMVQGCC